MAQVEIYNSKKEVVGKAELAPWWEGPIHASLIHQSVVSACGGMRRGTAAAKTRSEVKGSTRKQFRQKGTGRARQGSIRASQMRGGGVVFGPEPRDFSKSMNKKAKRKSLKSALAHKAATGSLVVLDGIALDAPKTRDLVALMDQLDIDSALIAVLSVDDNLRRASGNLSWVKVVPIEKLNVYETLAYEDFIITKEALVALEGVLVK